MAAKNCSKWMLALLLLGAPALSWGALSVVGPINLANGYPLWYEDAIGVQTQLCLDAVNCGADAPIVGNAFSQAIGFGSEAFYWSAEASAAGGGIDGLLVLALEAAWINEVPVSGDQMVFGRVRLKIDVDTAGAYTVTHPFGVNVYNVAAVGPGLEIIDTVDIGCAVAPCDFALVLGSGVGPFLTSVNPAPPPGFLGNPGAGATVTGGTNGNTFSIAGPAATASTNLFSVQGALFVPGTNVAPVGVDDVRALATNDSIVINATANDTDLFVAGLNDHEIDSRATGIVVTLPPVTAAQTVLSVATLSGSVVKNTNGSFTYTPNATFSGIDSFQYVVQDTGGFLSDVTTVSITVEDLRVSSAMFRTKVGKWSVSGHLFPASSVTLHAGDSIAGKVIGTATVDPIDNTWTVEGGNIVVPDSTKQITAVTVNGTAFTFPLSTR